MNIHLEHDLPDPKFVNIVANCLQPLGLFDVIVSDCEKIEDFDWEKKTELEKCDIFVLLLGRLSSKASLINKEIEIVEKKGIIVVPFYMGKIPRIWRALPSLSSYQENFIGRDEKGIAIRLLQVIRLMDRKFHIPVELVRKAREELEKYKPMREREGVTVNRKEKLNSAFIEVIRNILQSLGYEVNKNPIRIVFVTDFFDLQISEDGKKIWVKCFSKPPSGKKVSKILSILPKDAVCWIIHGGRKITAAARARFALVKDSNVIFVDAFSLAKGVKNSIERDFFIRKIYALSFGDLKNYWEDQRFLEFIKSPKKIVNPTILEAPILKLENMINQRETAESKYQELIKKNPWILGAQFESIQDQRKFNDENIPDFIGIRALDGLSDIIEIKQPFLELFRGDKKFNSNFNDAWNQIERYLNFVREEKDYLRRKGLNFGNPKCIFIAGYKIDPICLRKIRRKERFNPSVEFISYDQLISYAETTVKFLREMTSN